MPLKYAVVSSTQAQLLTTFVTRQCCLVETLKPYVPYPLQLTPLVHLRPGHHRNVLLTLRSAAPVVRLPKNVFLSRLGPRALATASSPGNLNVNCRREPGANARRRAHSLEISISVLRSLLATSYICMTRLEYFAGGHLSRSGGTRRTTRRFSNSMAVPQPRSRFPQFSGGMEKDKLVWLPRCYCYRALDEMAERFRPGFEAASEKKAGLPSDLNGLVVSGRHRGGTRRALLGLTANPRNELPLSEPPGLIFSCQLDAPPSVLAYRSEITLVLRLH